MISLEFKNWLMLEAERISLNQVDDSCKTTCPNSTVIWLITLEENWQQYKNLSPDEVEEIKYFVKEYDGGEYIEGLESGKKNNFKFKSMKYNKEIDIIPQEDEANGTYAIGVTNGVKPLSGGSISVRPRKITQSDEFGNYVSISEKITIPSEIISKILAVGGCALTCLHLSGGHVDAKTVGGYKKTYLFHNNQDLFYNNTLEDYFKNALKALYEKCLGTDPKKDVDHYAIRLNGTTDIRHFEKKFKLDQNTIAEINKTINRYNNKKPQTKFNTINLSIEEPVNFFDVFNQMWKKATKKINCNFSPTFLKFYDYTAISGLSDAYANKKLPKNYHITFSAKEGNLKQIMNALKDGLGVALPIWIGGSKKTNKIGLPQMWYPLGFSTGIGYRIIDGDQYDARFLDKKIYKIKSTEGYIVGLRAKGKLEDVQDFDSGFSERILLDVKFTTTENLTEFAKKYNFKILENSPSFEDAKNDFMAMTNSHLNPRFNPDDPAINKIILEQIIYTLRRNEIPINNLGKLSDRNFYHSQEDRGMKRLLDDDKIDLRDLDYDDLHSIHGNKVFPNQTYAGTSAKTDKGVAKKPTQTYAGSSAKVQKSFDFKVATHQTNMVPDTSFIAMRNKLEYLRDQKIKDQQERDQKIKDQQETI